MKLSYNDEIKNIVIDGQGDIIILNVDVKSLKVLEDRYGLHLQVKGFECNGKPKIKDKLRMIFMIIKMK